MLKSCNRCGRVHEHDYQCTETYKRIYRKGVSLQDKFRSTKLWRGVRNDVVARDKALCQVCVRDMYHTFGRIYDSKSLEVHHIVPLAEDFELRVEPENLITLCPYHHKMAEVGEIPREELLKIVQEQREKEQKVFL